jgi:AGCS family alanine or glycine:cation symporter
MLIAFFFCIYGVEVLQFNMVKTSLVTNFDLNEYITIAVLIIAVLWVGAGGVSRVGQVCAAIIPVFTVLYVGMGMWVLIQNAGVIPEKLALVVRSAFTGHAAAGGFVGSSAMMAITQGARWGCYTSDIGVGYAAVLHSETSISDPSKQAGLTIFEIVLDTFVICTTSILLILVTDIWMEPIHESLLVQTVLSQYFPYMHIFMPIFLLVLGYSTIISYFAFGLKAAHFLSHRWGKPIFYGYAVVMLTVFSFVDTGYALAIMNITGGLLLVINVFGMWRLRDEISFDITGEKKL